MILEQSVKERCLRKKPVRFAKPNRVIKEVQIPWLYLLLTAFGFALCRISAIRKKNKGLVLCKPLEKYKKQTKKKNMNKEIPSDYTRVTEILGRYTNLSSIPQSVLEN